MAITPKAVGGRLTVVQLRAKITPDEYHALRLLALNDRREVSELVADALRKTYNLGEK